MKTIKKIQRNYHLNQHIKKSAGHKGNIVNFMPTILTDPFKKKTVGAKWGCSYCGNNEVYIERY